MLCCLLALPPLSRALVRWPQRPSRQRATTKEMQVGDQRRKRPGGPDRGLNRQIQKHLWHLTARWSAWGFLTLGHKGLCSPSLLAGPFVSLTSPEGPDTAAEPKHCPRSHNRCDWPFPLSRGRVRNSELAGILLNGLEVHCGQIKSTSVFVRGVH